MSGEEWVDPVLALTDLATRIAAGEPVVLTVAYAEGPDRLPAGFDLGLEGAGPEQLRHLQGVLVQALRRVEAARLALAEPPPPTQRQRRFQVLPGGLP